MADVRVRCDQHRQRIKLVRDELRHESNDDRCTSVRFDVITTEPAVLREEAKEALREAIQASNRVRKETGTA